MSWAWWVNFCAGGWWLRSSPKPDLYAVPGGLLSLSGEALQDFLQTVLAKGAAFRFRARGASMNPFIRDGDVVTLSPWEGDFLSSGDVVAFCHPETGRLVIHRIVRKKSQGFLLRGDSCLKSDGLVQASGIFGRVTKVERSGRVLRLGLGPEAQLLALLARCNLLQLLVSWTSKVLGPILKVKRI